MSSFLLTALLAFILCISLYSLVRGRWVLAFFKASAAIIGLFVSLFGLFLIWQSSEFRLIENETNVAEVYIEKLDEQQFRVRLLRPEIPEQSFVLYGDSWQLDARVMSWTGLPLWLTPSASYRLERLSGRYNSIVQERNMKRSVYAINSDNAGYQIWTWLDEFPFVPGLRLKYGSSTYVPMVGDGVYKVSISSTGLKVLPWSNSSTKALENWQ